MPSYAFYCCGADDVRGYFELLDLESEHAAADHARALLAEHRSAVHVEVLLGEAEVARIRREAPAATDPTALASALQAAFGGYPEFAVIATTTDGIVRHWDEAAVRLYGWGTDEALGRNILDLTPARQSHAQAAMIMSTLAAGEAWQGEITLRRRDGVPFRAFVADFPVELAGERLIVGVSAPAGDRRAFDTRRPEIEDRLRAVLA